MAPSACRGLGHSYSRGRPGTGYQRYRVVRSCRGRHESICVQIRRVPRQPLQMQPLGRSSRQVVLDRLSLVDRRPIPDHQHLAVDLAQEHPQESDDPLRVEGGLLDLHHQASVECDATDGREMIMRQLDREHGRLAFGRPGAFRMRQQIEARLIYPDDGVSFLDCLFLMAGQRSSRH